MVLALALSRAQRPAEAVEVLDRALPALAGRHAELALLLEVAAVGAGMNGAVTAPIVAARRQALRERATKDLSAPPELLAVSAFIAVLTNEPADVGARLALRALEAAPLARDQDDERPWFSFATWFSQVTVSLIWAERYAEVRPLLDASIAEARATGDSSRLAVGLAHRGWLALRRGISARRDRHAHGARRRRAAGAGDVPRAQRRRARERADRSGRAGRGRAGARSARRRGRGGLAHRRRAAYRARPAAGGAGAGRRRARGLPRGRRAGNTHASSRARAISRGDRRPRSPTSRSASADAAKRLAQEELALARAFGAPRALGVAQTAAGVVAGGERARRCCARRSTTLGAGDATLERARALTDLGALLRRRNRRSEARELLREALDAAHRAGARRLRRGQRQSCAQPEPGPGASSSAGVESLTASERRVAELASQDLTNREIAQSLFVTARTVEGHLTSVFRKLQLDSRDQLAAALAGDTAER